MRDMLNFPDASLMNDISAGNNDFMNTHLDLASFHQPPTQLEQPQSQNQLPLNAYTTPETSNDASAKKQDAPGAGPLPTGYGVELPPHVGSTLTEFTKRRNWSQHIVEELQDSLHVLSPDGQLVYVSPSTKSLTGHDTRNLVGKFIADFIHPDDKGTFMREFNESIATGHPLRFFYRFRKADSTYIIFECHGHPHFSEENNISANTGFCRGFFMVARPYPTKNAALLDAFLEHKIENERLKKRIADVKREEWEEAQSLYGRPLETQQQIMPETPILSSPHRQQFNEKSIRAIPTSPSHYNGMPPPAKPSASNIELTQRNLDQALSASRPDSINDKMARYEGANHLETIEMLTGLRYQEGERSHGISTGAFSPDLMRSEGNVISMPAVESTAPALHEQPHDGDDNPGSDKKRRLKTKDEYVCTDCGTLDSPEWRRGPTGPKTLCNACGLRWAKKEKRRTGVSIPGQPEGGESDDTPKESSVQSSNEATRKPPNLSHETSVPSDSSNNNFQEMSGQIASQTTTQQSPVSVSGISMAPQISQSSLSTRQ